MTIQAGTGILHHPRARMIALSLRLAAIAALVVITNDGFMQRVLLLIDQGRFGTLAGFLAIWALSLIALLIAAFQRNTWLRIGWGVILALTTAVGYSYRLASGAEFGLLDAVSLWNARHEAARAMDFYTADVYRLVFALCCGAVVMAVPPAATGERLRRWLGRLAWAPAVPVAIIAAIMVVKEGGGAQALPAQFAPLSVGVVAGWKVATISVPARSNVAWSPGRPEALKIALIVDESVRGDFIDWTAGNPNTPELARLKSQIVDFGPAASGGNCSHYSNALLRFAAARNEVGPKLLTNPTIWQYAKRAGFRTVFIDAQAAFNRNPGKLQNFMTAREANDIDAFYALDADTPAYALDDRLLDILKDELSADRPVFIYAVKNGAHFPYDRGYPAEEARFRPTMADSGRDSVETRVNSYRNVVRWSVDRFFKRLFDEARLTDAAIIYTSDHGQSFNPRRLSHCTVEDPDPREALVPLFVIPGSASMRARLVAAAESNRGSVTHFSIVPTVLEMLGYRRSDLARVYADTLLEPHGTPPTFTTGDIFGLFSSKVRWHAIDLFDFFGDPSSKPAAEAQPDHAKRARIPDATVAR
jgi:glucan phosphoethanolaminetransferase (alkaline phosphatase superfamily)